MFSLKLDVYMQKNEDEPDYELHSPPPNSYVERPNITVLGNQAFKDVK